MSAQPPPTPPPQTLPYATPQPSGKPCPRCGQPAAKPVGFTWWGGALGPKLFSHHKCHACQYTFNAKTGQPNTTAITLYVVISSVIAIFIVALIAFLRR